MNKNKKIALLFLMIASLIGALLLTNCAADLQGKDKNSELFKIEFLEYGKVNSTKYSDTTVNEIVDVPGDRDYILIKPIISNASKVEITSNSDGLLEYMGNLIWKVNILEKAKNTFSVSVTSESLTKKTYEFKISTKLNIQDFTIKATGSGAGNIKNDVKAVVFDTASTKDVLISMAGDIDLPKTIPVADFEIIFSIGVVGVAGRNNMMSIYDLSGSDRILKDKITYSEWSTASQIFNDKVLRSSKLSKTMIDKYIGYKVDSSIRVDLSSDVSKSKLSDVDVVVNYTASSIYFDETKILQTSYIGNTITNALAKNNLCKIPTTDSTNDAMNEEVFNNSIIYTLVSKDGTMKKFRLYAGYENTSKFTEQEIFQHVAVTPFGVTVICTLDTLNDNYYIIGNKNFRNSQFGESNVDDNTAWALTGPKLILLDGMFRGKYLRGYNIYKPSNPALNNMEFRITKGVGDSASYIFTKGEPPYMGGTRWGINVSSVDFTNVDDEYIILPEIYARGDISGGNFNAVPEFQLFDDGAHGDGAAKDGVYTSAWIDCVEGYIQDTADPSLIVDNKMAPGKHRWKIGAGNFSISQEVWILSGSFDFSAMADNFSVKYGEWETTQKGQNNPNYSNEYTAGKSYRFHLDRVKLLIKVEEKDTI